jgi:hypothetical protein
MKKSLFVLMFVAAFAAQFSGRAVAGPADDVQAAMQLLKSKAATLGTPNLKGEEAVAGKAVPALYFGETKRKRVGRPRYLLRLATNLCAWQQTLRRTTDQGQLAPF